MRSVFLLLLVANIAMFAWLYSGQDSASDQAAAAARPGVDTIVLLSEVDDADSPPQEPLAGAMLDTPEQQAPGESEVEAPVPPKEVATAAVGADTAPSAAQPAAESCYTLGPFRDLDQLREIIKSIRDEVIEASFRSREEREQSMFWVFLAPEADLESARARTLMLRQKNIKDYYIIRDDDKKFGISLGLFSEKQRAHSHRDRIAGLGFKPLIEPVFKTYTIYWLDYRLGSGKDISQLLGRHELDESVTHFDRACS